MPTKMKAATKTTVKKTVIIKDPFTKSQMLGDLAENTGLTKKQVSTVLEELETVIERHIKKQGPGLFTMPGLFKVKVIKKPATKARKGINPFTKEEIMIKAKPARNVVKVLPLKKLKDMIS